jgi:hypothetical protein
VVDEAVFGGQHRVVDVGVKDRATVVRPSLLTAPIVLYPGTSPSCDQ